MAPRVPLASAQGPALPPQGELLRFVWNMSFLAFLFLHFCLPSMQPSRLYSLVLPGLEFYVIQITQYAILMFVIQ